MKRRKIPLTIQIAVLTEAGYRCAVPTCRTILALDLHHIVEVEEDGPNELGNLLALCPTCHRLFHRGEISRDSIYAWKSVLVTLSHAFDLKSLDLLLFLRATERSNVSVSGDGVLQFARLIASGLVQFLKVGPASPTVVASDYDQYGRLPPQFYPSGLSEYQLTLTENGKRIVNAWASGDRPALAGLLGQESSLR